MMTNKEQYKQLCDTQPDIPLFMQYWWMQAVCIGKEWDVLLSFDPQGNIQGALPYLFRKRMGMKYIVCPQETQINGLWTLASLTKEQRQSVYDDIIQQLNQLGLAYYYQHFPLHSEAPDYFDKHKFTCKKRWTYRIDDLSNLDYVISQFSKNKKRQLQKAFSLHADFSLTADEFYHFHVLCLQEQGKTISYSKEFFHSLYTAATERQQGQIIAIKNAEGTLLSALFLVWDHQAAYYLIPCYSKTYAATGASALNVLEAIKFARQHVNVFDFEGSMIKGIANSYRQFGTTKHEYYSVSRYYKMLFRFAIWYNKLKTRKQR